MQEKSRAGCVTARPLRLSCRRRSAPKFSSAMKRADLEHILRASKALTGEIEFIVIGSQSILGRFPDAPRELRQSMEADLYPRFRPELAALIEGSLGELSTFETTHGYRADG